ncbi:CHASE2 domain protein [Treponema socranskii subsp. socranskii VPI DR56BR1116 = ATCC 35536]|uniref:CHASE2 domain protein n=1 Tax=Treponema socranskii subsp. socranskii VPI DR56BR1116 = ATCC 35536 TaxID=1125725 RepID=U1GT98_TRESO|nr:CHASE2 domain-containing protein [Treponema socranskii]ERF61160.1 CHASE2 domain protein [Treponema socranskii subsp. socranskii VPI DR56BR1116 = ATCC 35536]ERK00828.1 CHASE2 domain protein [Treponema socranskii subsp. socranskii VPI DR56BR1116 = ATCC 35536]
MAQQKKTKKRSSFFTSLGFIVLVVTAAVFSALGVFGFFQKLDYRMYDFLLSLRREPKQSEKILFVNIDDESIQALGEWPWSRDIIADCLLRIRELGAESVVFDVEYLSPSPRGVAPNAEENMNAAISAGRSDITGVINELSESVSRGFISRAELPAVTKDMIADYIDPALSNMRADIASKMYRDNDDYFARAIQFFGNTWLTVNTRDVAITLSDEDKAYAQKRILLSNVTDAGGFIPRDINIRPTNSTTDKRRDSLPRFIRSSRTRRERVLRTSSSTATARGGESNYSTITTENTRLSFLLPRFCI